MINFSENIEALEEVILAYLLSVDDAEIVDEAGSPIDKSKLIKSMKADYFTVQFYHDMFSHIYKFHANYSKIPNLTEILKMFQLSGEQVDSQKLESIKNTSVASFSNDFIYKNIRAFLMVKTLNSQINKVAIKLKTEKPNPDTIDSVIDYVRTELSEKIVVDISNSGNGLDIYNVENHIQPDRQSTSTGFEYFDIVQGGGYEPKTFVVFQGRAKIGKSMVMANMAVRAAKRGSNVGIYTVELGGSKYVKRVGSNMFDVPAMEYNKFSDSEHMSPLVNAIEKFKNNYPNAGHVDIKESPTGAATVLDIENYYIQYQKKNNCKMDVIFVDYLNLLKPADSSMSSNMYLSIKKICEDLRRIAQRNNWCVVSATQIKTSAFSSDDLGLDSTAESSGLIATVDTLYGIMGEPDSPYVKFKCIANRDGGYMNSCAHFVKDMNFFRLNEDQGEYMQLGEEALINAENYQKYKETEAKTYTPDSNQQDSAVSNNIELHRVDDNATVMQQVPQQPQDVQAVEPPQTASAQSEFKPIENQKGNDDDSIPFSIDAPIDNLPLGEVSYQTPVVVNESPTNNGQAAYSFIPTPSSRTTYATSMPVDDQQTQVRPVSAQAQQCNQPNTYQANPAAQQQYTQQVASQVQQPVQVQPQYTQFQTQVQQPVQQYAQTQVQPPVQQVTAQMQQAQPQAYQHASNSAQQFQAQPVQNYAQPVAQAQYASSQPQAKPCNDTSTLIVNNLTEDEKLSILNNNLGVQSIVDML